jgi:UDP-N-acetylmuramate--alanine ligase
MNRKHYHLAGVGGVGMSALAQALVDAGHQVSGSDRFLDQGQVLEIFDQLRAGGVRLVPQDGSALNPTTAGLIYSTAIEKDNPEIQAAQRLGIPLLHRARMLADLTAGHPCIAIAGTCGKTTVTGMVGWIFECLGEDPHVVNGGAVLNWRNDRRVGNVRAGASNLWIVEVDESDRSLLNFNPDWAIITNISKDHFELDEVEDLFRTFAGQVKTSLVGGEGVPAILKKKPEAAASLPQLFESKITPVRQGDGYRFDFKGVEFQVPLAGEHNALNAAAAVLLCDRMGKDLKVVREALKTFKGIQRRLEKVGVRNGVTVLDDYAHNPAKIKAAWSAVRPFSKRVFGVWRPHGFGPLAAMMEELAAAFSDIYQAGDEIVVLPVFYAGGTTQRSVSSDDLVTRLIQRGVSARVLSDYPALESFLTAQVKSGDTVLCMGARDPQLPLFARQWAHS